MQYIHPKRNNYAMTAVASTLLFFVFGIMTFRRHGLGTDWARIKSLCMSGEYRTLVEAGALPENRHLPPFLRLDKLSYLDRKDTEVAFPPLYNAAESTNTRLASLDGQLPRSDRGDIKVNLGPIRAHSISMSRTTNEKYVRRRLDVSEDERARAAQDEREAHQKWEESQKK